jgi:hypothetical protein
VTRLQLSGGVAGLVFVGAIGLYLLWRLIGDVTWYLLLVAAIAGTGVWLFDFVTEKLADRQRQRIERGSTPGE